MECRNILWKEVLRGEYTPDGARFIWGGLEQQPITTFPSRLLLDLALEMAFDTNRTVYENCYLVLAMLLGYQLVTADQKLIKALQGSSYATNICWVVNLP